MSVKAMTWAFEQTTDQPVDKLILLALADYCDDQGECWPSRKRLADRGMCSLDTVDRAIKRLEALELVAKEKRAHKSGGLTSSCYALAMNAVKVRELQEGAPLAANCGHLPSEKPSRTDAPTLAAPCGHPSRTDAATLAAQDAATGTLIKPPFEKTPLTPHGEVVANAPTKASKKPDGISKAECIGAFIQFSELAQRIGLPIPATMTPGREKSIRSRLRDHGAASWSTALAAIEASDFLRGRTEKADFKISLDWLISPKNFPKVIEGNYGPKIAVSTSETHWTQDPAKVAAVTPDQWRGSIAKYANGTWPVDKLGYWPGHRNCIVPAQIVRELRLLDKYDEVCGIAKGEWKLKQDEAHA